MHATTFALKRGHLLSLAMLRAQLKPFARLELTPARADLLNLIRVSPPYQLLQRDIAGSLGVTRSTISRMLIRLEAMRLIVRRYRPGERKRKEVLLSPEGLLRLRVLIRRLMDAGVVDRALRNVFRAAPGEMRRPHATLLTDLRRYAARLGDGATSPYVARILGERPKRWPWPSIRVGEVEDAGENENGRPYSELPADWFGPIHATVGGPRRPRRRSW
jgi:DNA-binding MarR family transcriptional regulator